MASRTNVAIIALILCIIILVIVVLCIPNNRKSEEIIIPKVDTLLIVKDSIERQIDAVYINIEKEKIQYEENRNIIINNSTDEDYLFFKQYLDKSGLDSINN